MVVVVVSGGFRVVEVVVAVAGTVEVVDGATVVVVVVSIIVNKVLNSSSFKDVWPKTTGGVGAVVIVLHFS